MARRGSKRAAKKKADSSTPSAEISSSPELEEMLAPTKGEEEEQQQPQPQEMSLLKQVDDIAARLNDLDRKSRLALDSFAGILRQPTLHCRPIGFVKSAYPEKTGTPRQGMLCPYVRAELTIEKDVFTNAEHSLDGLSGFSHVWLIFWFHLNRGDSVKAKVKPPRLEGKETKGVFATRSPHRPNPLGLSLVRLDRIEGATLHITGVDLVDGTPVLDVKPFVDPYDVPVETEDTTKSLNWVAQADSERPNVEGVEFTSHALKKLKLYHSRCAEGCEYCLHHIDEALFHAALRELLKTDLRSRYRRDKCSDRIQIVFVDNIKVSIWYDDEGYVHVLNLEPRRQSEADGFQADSQRTSQQELDEPEQADISDRLTSAEARL